MQRTTLPDQPPAQTRGARKSSKPAVPVAGDGPSAGPWRRPAPPKLYRIGEVADYSGVSRQTIHNYTTMGLIEEAKWTDGGHRLYDEGVFERLDLIIALKADNKTLEDIRGHFQTRYGPG